MVSLPLTAALNLAGKRPLALLTQQLEHRRGHLVRVASVVQLLVECLEELGALGPLLAGAKDGQRGAGGRGRRSDEEEVAAFEGEGLVVAVTDEVEQAVGEVLAVPVQKMIIAELGCTTKFVSGRCKKTSTQNSTSHMVGMTILLTYRTRP
jgi:hypothetical protein